MSRSNDRMALLRARRKCGLRYIGIEVRDAEVSELVRRGLIAGDVDFHLEVSRFSE